MVNAGNSASCKQKGEKINCKKVKTFHCSIYQTAPFLYMLVKIYRYPSKRENLSVLLCFLSLKSLQI